MRRAVILARVSTKDQEEYGHSLPAQIERLREYAKRKGFEIAQEFAFSESAGTKIRKKFEEVLSYLRRHDPMPALFCQNVDRITRNFRDAVDLDELRQHRGLEIHFVQENFVLNANASGSEMFMWEAKVFLAKQYINRLTDDAVRSFKHKVAKGEWIAKAPLGYLNAQDTATARNTVVLDRERAFLVKRLFTEYATGTNSFGELQRKATDWGLRTHKGNPVALQTLANILENPFYCGLMRVKGSLYLHAYPTLIDRQTFDACQAVRVKPETRQQAVRKTKEDFILRGLVTCAISGRKATCDLKKGRYVYLIVRDPSTPDRKVWVKENVVLDQVRDVLRAIHIPEGLLAEMMDYLRQSHEAEKDFHHDRIRDLQKESEELTQRLDRLTDLLLDRSITRDIYDRKHQQIAERQQEINYLLQDSHEADSQFKIALSGLISLASKAPDLFDRSNNAEKRLLIGFVFSNLTLEGPTLGYSLRKPFDLLVDLAKSQEWRPILDALRTTHKGEVTSLYGRLAEHMSLTS